MHPLDRPIWNALTGPQAHFAEVSGSARRFPPAVTTLGALDTIGEQSFADLASLQESHQVTALFLEQAPQLPAGWRLVMTLPLLQMVYQEGSASSQKSRASTPRWSEMGTTDEAEMLALAKLTEPGPFGTRTRELGTFLGVRHEGKLVAMAGVRLHVPGFTEVSAVCTHPDHTGRGYAAELTLEVMARIRQRGETPFLHVRGNNTRAIPIYERLGFKKRTQFHLAVVQKPQ